MDEGEGQRKRIQTTKEDREATEISARGRREQGGRTTTGGGRKTRKKSATYRDWKRARVRRSMEGE